MEKWQELGYESVGEWRRDSERARRAAKKATVTMATAVVVQWNAPVALPKPTPPSPSLGGLSWPLQAVVLPSLARAQVPRGACNSSRLSCGLLHRRKPSGAPARLSPHARTCLACSAHAWSPHLSRARTCLEPAHVSSRRRRCRGGFHPSLLGARILRLIGRKSGEPSHSGRLMWSAAWEDCLRRGDPHHRV